MLDGYLNKIAVPLFELPSNPNIVALPKETSLNIFKMTTLPKFKRSPEDQEWAQIFGWDDE